MKQFTHPQGESHLVQAVPLKKDGTPGVTAADVTYTVDDPTIASATANNAVAQDLQVTIVYLKPGTATVTATGVDELGNQFSSQFQAVVTAADLNLTDHFDFNEVS